MSDPITKITQLDYRLTRIADAASSRSRIVAKRLPNAAQAARLRAAAARFTAELLEIASELSNGTALTSLRGGQPSAISASPASPGGRLDFEPAYLNLKGGSPCSA